VFDRLRPDQEYPWEEKFLKIIAFDYFDSYAREYGIFCADQMTKEVALINANSILFFPPFSKNDNKRRFITEKV
jgi:hypothetical protein